MTNNMYEKLKPLKLYVYEVEKVDNYKNTAETLDYDYSKDFERLKELRGYIKHDYYITDSSDLKPGEVWFTGDLIKIIKQITSFDGYSMQLVCL